MGQNQLTLLARQALFQEKFDTLRLQATYGTAIFYGDFVKLVAAGTVEKAAVTTSVVAGTVGIFMGCSYTDPTTSQMTFSQHYPASTVASDIMALVVTILNCYSSKCRVTKAIAQTGLGNNVSAVNTAGSTSIGRSRNALDGGSIATTNTSTSYR